MWIICGIVSVAFCLLAWIMAAKKNHKASWAAVCSLALVSLTILMEYRMVLNWIVKEDWSAVLDAVPSMLPVLTGYVIVMFLANIVPVVILEMQG